MTFCFTAMLAVNEEAVTPKVTHLMRQSFRGWSRSEISTGSGAGLYDAVLVNFTAQYILLTLAVSATGCNQYHRRTSINGGWMVGPTRNVSLISDIPVEDLAEASSTTRTLVVALEAL